MLTFLKDDYVVSFSSKSARLNGLYIVESEETRNLSLAVCIGYTKEYRPYMYTFGGLVHKYVKPSRTYRVYVDFDYLNAFKDLMIRYAFTKGIERSQIIEPKRAYDVGLGVLDIADYIGCDMQTWYLKQKLINPNLPDVLFEKDNKKYKRVGKKDLKPYSVYALKKGTLLTFAIYNGIDYDGDYVYYAPDSYSIKGLITGKLSFERTCYKTWRKTLPAFYELETVKDLISSEQMPYIEYLKKQAIVLSQEQE